MEISVKTSPGSYCSRILAHVWQPAGASPDISSLTLNPAYVGLKPKHSFPAYSLDPEYTIHHGDKQPSSPTWVPYHLLLLPANSVPRPNAGWWESSDQQGYWVPPPSTSSHNPHKTLKAPLLPSFGEMRWNETNVRARSHLLAHVTRNKNPFLAISLVLQFLLGPSCVAGKYPMFVAGNTLFTYLDFSIYVHSRER